MVYFEFCGIIVVIFDFCGIFFDFSGIFLAIVVFFGLCFDFCMTFSVGNLDCETHCSNSNFG